MRQGPIEEIDAKADIEAGAVSGGKPETALLGGIFLASAI
jgi:hypothetical protein